MKKYNYVKILHRGEDYILVRHGKAPYKYGNEYEITGMGMIIIETLIKKIEKLENNILNN